MNDNKKRKANDVLSELGIEQSKLERISIPEEKLTQVNSEHRAFVKKFASYGIALLSPSKYSIKGGSERYTFRFECNTIDGFTIHKLCTHFDAEEYILSGNQSGAIVTIRIQKLFIQ